MAMRRWMALGPAAALLAAACVGNIGGGGEETPPSETETSTPTDFACDESLVPESLPLRRLSQRQYRNTLSDLARFAVPSEADAIVAEITPSLSQLVDDVRVGDDIHYAGLTRLDQAVQQGHIDAAYAIAAALGSALTGTDARLEELAGGCATDADPSNDQDCIEELIRRFGERALRRAVTDADVAFYSAPAGSTPHSPADYADVVALLLNAPHLLYFVEHGVGEDETAPLDAYELASRLSYHFWQTLPDDALFDAARTGALLDEERYREELERIYAHPKTREALTELFGEWLQNSTLDPLDARIGDPAFDAMRGAMTPSATLRDEMWNEVVDSALFYATDETSTFEDFVRSDRSFARTEALASVYEVPVWDGDSEPPTMTQPERAGLLTRAAYVATGSARTRPIMKGVFLRKAFLCDALDPPPPDAPTTVAFRDGMSTREVVEEMTSTGSCAGCHATQINGLGFPTEGFDPLGRVRAEEPLFDFATGEVLGAAAVNTVASPRVDGDDEPVTDAHGLTDRVLESPKPYACFARQYYRFTFGRREDIQRDGCALETIQDALTEGQPLAEVLRTIALSPQFQHRTFTDESSTEETD